jgi:hypothetical protein
MISLFELKCIIESGFSYLFSVPLAMQLVTSLSETSSRFAQYKVRGNTNTGKAHCKLILTKEITATTSYRQLRNAVRCIKGMRIECKRKLTKRTIQND